MSYVNRIINDGLSVVSYPHTKKCKNPKIPDGVESSIGMRFHHVRFSNNIGGNMVLRPHYFQPLQGVMDIEQNSTNDGMWFNYEVVDANTIIVRPGIAKWRCVSSGFRLSSQNRRLNSDGRWEACRRYTGASDDNVIVRISDGRVTVSKEELHASNSAPTPDAVSFSSGELKDIHHKYFQLRDNSQVNHPWIELKESYTLHNNSPWVFNGGNFLASTDPVKQAENRRFCQDMMDINMDTVHIRFVSDGIPDQACGLKMDTMVNIEVVPREHSILYKMITPNYDAGYKLASLYMHLKTKLKKAHKS